MTHGKALTSNIFNQLAALLYKELLIRKFHYISTSFQIIFPILIASIPCMVYNKFPNSEREDQRKLEWVDFKTFEPMEVMTIFMAVHNNLEFVYAPSNKVIDEFMIDSVRAFSERYRYEKYSKIPKKMNSEEELRKYIEEQQKMDEEKEIIGTVFKGFGNELPEDLDYKIFYVKDFSTGSKYKIGASGGYDAYTLSFLIRWQGAVGNTFIKKKSTALNKEIDYEMYLQRFPITRHKSGTGLLAYTYDAEFFIHLGFILFAAVILKGLIEEKTDGSKELMETMGMMKSSYWASIFISNFIIALIISLIVAIIYKTSIKLIILYVESNFFLIFIILLLFAANLILFCMTFSIFFKSVAFGVVTLMIVLVLSHQCMVRMMYNGDIFDGYFSLSLFHKLCICIYPGGALFTAYLIIQLFESTNEGLQWSNLTEYSMVPDINMLMVIGMMVFSCFFYIVAIWYFDAVWPWQPGKRKSFYFFFTKSYWLGEERAVLDGIELMRSGSALGNFEEEPRNAIKSVVIQDLSKVIQQGNSSKTILHDTFLNCYEGQITAILGHGEAGKTSIINILAGKELPTKGSVSISGLDIFTNLARKLLGVCLQQNILYEEFTVEQHLKLYAAMKGTSLRQLTDEAEQVMKSLKLLNKKTETVSSLSYAEKRKLSLGIAIVGDSKVLLLDEPTYGMDVEAKKHVWDALEAIKHDRTILLTTQSCEEADILGNRIALMTEGEIYSCGTPAFIKQKLGSGYFLHVLKNVNFEMQGLNSLLTNHVSTITCVNDSYKEVSFYLGNANELGELFEELDNRKNDLGISSYDLSLSTIKDILLAVSNTSHTKQSLPAGAAMDNTSTEREDVSKNSLHPALNAALGNQFQALLLKQFHYFKRQWKFQIVRLVVPFFLMLIYFYCMYAELKSQFPPLKMDISTVYGTTDAFYYNKEPRLSDLVDSFKKVLETNSVNVKNASEPTHYALDYATKDFANYLKRLVVGGAFDKGPSESLNLTAWFNSGSVHSMPMSLLLMQTALLRHITDKGSMSLTLESIMPLRQKVIFNSYREFGFPLTDLAPYFVPMAFIFLSLSFLLVPTHERTTKVKFLQLMSGIPAPMYWLAIFLWDYLIYFVICIFLILPPAFFFHSIFFGAHSEAIGTLLALFLLYGWASLPLGYIISNLFKRENRVYFVFIAFCTLFSVVSFAIISKMIPYLIGINYENIYGLQDALWFCRLFPIYSISMGALYNFQIALNNAKCDIYTPKDLAQCGSVSRNSAPSLFYCCKDACGGTGQSCHEFYNHFSLKKYERYYSNGPEALFLGLEGIIFFAILFLLETRTATKFLNIINLHLQNTRDKITRIVLRKEPQGLRVENVIDDPQVLQEEERIRNLVVRQQGSGDEALVVLDFARKIGMLPASNRLTFGVNREQNFGILGVNGAGKTSLFRMLTGDGLPFEGNAFIQRCSLIGDFKKFLSHIGYCPEVDALIDELTGREMLLLFGQMRGLRGNELQNSVNDLIRNMGLLNCSNELTQFYSGGEKRKLSVAIALIGSPPIVLLDEPTARLSPESRRLILTVLTRVPKKTRAAVLLATQCTEESKALCSRLAFMVNGRFRRLGSTEQLKSKHGQGHMLTIKISKGQQQNPEAANTLKNHIQNSLQNATLTDDYQGKLQYQVTDSSMTVCKLFKFMSIVKDQFELEDFSISVISIEQIFQECTRT